ncbi:MAG: RecX family transcriptional regulator [Clostridia bacterium]|nr:RecX family transcriptional regulator [Clostridia bacterium]
MRVTAVKPSRSKGYLVLVLSDNDKATRYTLREQEYTDVGSPMRGAELSDEAVESIRLFDEGYRARIFALRSLSLTDSSERALARKLALRGIRPSVVSEVVCEMVSLGYVNESSQLTAIVDRLANTDLFGPRRIMAKLTAKGYSPSAVRSAIDTLRADGSIDFSRSRAELIEKKLTRGATDDEIKKLLYKYGY